MAKSYSYFMVLPETICYILPPERNEWFKYSTSKKNIFCETQEIKTKRIDIKIFNQNHWLIAVKNENILLWDGKK